MLRNTRRLFLRWYYTRAARRTVATYTPPLRVNGRTAGRRRFVWVDYSAPWCGPCVRQAPIIRKLEKTLGDEVTFLTVIVSDQAPTKPSTRMTARVWAEQHNLDPNHVIAGREGLRFIPTHIVFSPLGQTLEFKSGMLSDAQIRETFMRVKSKYNGWYAENKNSTSVLLGEIGE